MLNLEDHLPSLCELQRSWTKYYNWTTCSVTLVQLFMFCVFCM